MGILGYLEQRKGWTYHPLPGLGFASAATGLLVGAALREALASMAPLSARTARTLKMAALVVPGAGVILCGAALIDWTIRGNVMHTTTPVQQLPLSEFE